MAQDAEELKAQIAQTREDLGQDLDVLSEKVTPSKVVGRRVDAAKGSLLGLKDRVMGSAEQLTSDMGSAKDSAGQSIAGSAHDLSAAVQGAPAQAKAKASGNPFAAGVVAFGVGLLVSGLFPSTEAEKQGVVKLKDSAQPLLEPIKAQAQQAVTEVKDNLTPAVQDAAASVKDSATSAVDATKGSAAEAVDTVKGAATDSAATVKDSATDSTGTVADQAKSSAGSVQDTAKANAPRSGR